MTEAEKERIRQEMMSDAQNREIERSIRVQEYKQADDQEKNASKTTGSGNFIKPLLSSAVDKNSLEDRIKQRKFTSQRVHGSSSMSSMDSNFARK